MTQQASIIPIPRSMPFASATESRSPWIIVPRFTDASNTVIGLFRQSIQQDGPESELLLDLERELWQSGQSPFQAALHQGDVALAPNSNRVTLLRYNQKTRVCTLEQYDLDANGEQEPVWLALSRERILPGTLQYGPEEDYLYYMQEDAFGERSLWKVRTDASDQNGTPLHVGFLDREYAIHPYKQQVLIARNTAESTELVLIDSATAKTVATVGHGQIHPKAWHPSGTYFIVTDKHSDRDFSVAWAVEAQAPWGRSSLLPDLHLAPEGAAISPKGQWAAVITEGEATQSVHLINLSTHLFSESKDRSMKTVESL